MKSNRVKCDICGRFISEEELANSEVSVLFIPDTNVTTEQTIYSHKECKKKLEPLGIYKGEKCNRNGCEGIIDEYEKDGGCSCHINPPCSYCEEDAAYCEACGWSGREEQLESWKRK